MSSLSIGAPALCSLALLSACSKDVAQPGPRVAVDIAPLTLPGVLGVEYALAVFNAAPSNPMHDVDGNVVGAGNLGQLVWQNASVTSNQYGNGPGGAISYVGPCDASAAENWVALTLRQIDVGNNNGSYNGSGPVAGTMNVLDDQLSAVTLTPGSNDGDADFENPCDFETPCVVKVRCAENEDTSVVFNLTVMRDAEQGFFDVAVDFEDIFCSMKVDTCYDGNRPIDLLFDEQGERVETAVIAAACSAGADEAGTVMWMSPLTVTCDGGVSFRLNPTGNGVPGNQGVDVIVGGTVSTPGAAATGTATFTLTPVGDSLAIVTIPAGTPITSDVTGLVYVTTAAATIDPATSSTADVPVRAVADGLAYNGATSFLPIQPFDATGAIRQVVGTGLDILGGVDPIITGGVQTVVNYALYWGDEELDCGDGVTAKSCNKAYWNVALNLDDLRDAGLQNCHVSTAITASGTPALPQFVNGGLAGPGQTYGFVQINAQVTNGTEPTCFQGPMGSQYAATRYGASPDMIGADPFPSMCYYFERGTAAPRSLGDIDGYFQDNDASPDDATYAGRIPTEPTAPRLELAFPGMGADGTGPCKSRVLNTSTSVWFDGAGSLDKFQWKGVGGTGKYRLLVFTRSATSGWTGWGGYEVDLREPEGRAFFAAGGVFPNAGDGFVALSLIRLDSPVATADDIVIKVGPEAP